MKKTSPKKENVSLNNFHKIADQLQGHLKQAKEKYDSMDPAARKKLLAGIGSVTAILVGRHAVKKAIKKRKNRSTK